MSVAQRAGTATWIAVALTLGFLAVSPLPLRGDESTVDSLQELQELRQEVERRRAELRRELRLMKQVLGEDEEPELFQLAGPDGSMTASELAAELRILREEIERLRQALTRRELSDRDARFEITGEVRSRLEWFDTDFTSGDANLEEFLRSRVAVTGKPRHDTRAVVQMQDARLWGEEAHTLEGSADRLDFHQAYLELEEMYDRPLSLRLGRQELAYGTQRLVGAVGWSNVGRSFDGMRLRYGRESHVDLLNAKLAEKGSRDRNLFGIYGHILHEQHAFDPYVWLEQDKNSDDQRLLRATTGLRAHGEVAGSTGHTFGYDVEGALQAGELGTRDIFAWMGTLWLIYKAPGWTKPQLKAGIDWLSGDGDPNDGKLKAFDTLFATNHKFYGLMDLFTDIPEDTHQGGLVDFLLKGEMSASESVRVGLHLHHFQLAKGVEKNLGQEADVILSYRFNEATSFDWGGLIFVPSDAMKASRGGEDPAFKTYSQLLVRF